LLHLQQEIAGSKSRFSENPNDFKVALQNRETAHDKLLLQVQQKLA
jgi:hypothetical protein